MKKGNKGMNSPVGMYSYKSNPMKDASRVKPMCGGGGGFSGNADQMKANKLLQQAQMKEDSLRGKMGM